MTILSLFVVFLIIFHILPNIAQSEASKKTERRESSKRSNLNKINERKELDENVLRNKTSTRKASKSSCSVRPGFIWGESYVEQWLAARRELNISRSANMTDCVERRSIVAYIENRPKFIGVEGRAFGGVLNSYRMWKTKCWTLSNDKATIIEYHRIWKNGNTKLCADFGKNMGMSVDSGIKYKEKVLAKIAEIKAMQRLNLTAADVKKSMNGTIKVLKVDRRAVQNMPIKRVTFVRDPIDHFISGYSEIQYRMGSRKKKRHNSSRPENLTISGDTVQFVKRAEDLKYLHRFEPSSTERRALAFVHDFIAGRLHHTNNLVDRHCFPQIGFIAPSAFPLDFIGNLSNASGDASYEHIPVRTSKDKSHKHTSAESGQQDRLALERLLDHEPTVKCALVRVLLPDYLCLGYALPKSCGYVLETSKFSCPIKHVSKHTTISGPVATAPLNHVR